MPEASRPPKIMVSDAATSELPTSWVDHDKAAAPCRGTGYEGLPSEPGSPAGNTRAHAPGNYNQHSFVFCVVVTHLFPHLTQPVAQCCQYSGGPLRVSITLTTSPWANPPPSSYWSLLNVPESTKTCELKLFEAVFMFGTTAGSIRGARHGAGVLTLPVVVSMICES